MLYVNAIEILSLPRNVRYDHDVINLSPHSSLCTLV